MAAGRSIRDILDNWETLCYLLQSSFLHKERVQSHACRYQAGMRPLNRLPAPGRDFPVSIFGRFPCAGRFTEKMKPETYTRMLRVFLIVYLFALGDCFGGMFPCLCEDGRIEVGTFPAGCNSDWLADPLANPAGAIPGTFAVSGFNQPNGCSDFLFSVQYLPVNLPTVRKPVLRITGGVPSCISTPFLMVSALSNSSSFPDGGGLCLPGIRSVRLLI